MIRLKVTYPTASKAIEDFCSINILFDIKPDQHRNKEYVFAEFLSILNKSNFY